MLAAFHVHPVFWMRPRDQGALKGPALDGIIPRSDDRRQHVSGCAILMPYSPAAMLNFHLSDREIDAILAYLATVNQP